MTNQKVVDRICRHVEFKHYQIDVKTAFLNGYFQEEVFMKQPPDFEDPANIEHIYKLDKHYMG